MCERFARSVTALKSTNAIELALADPRSALQGEFPHLVDEWQKAPEIWNEIKSDLDEDYEFDDIKIMHVYKYGQFSDSYDFTKQQHPRKEVHLENIQFYEKYLFDNYYDQIQDGFIKSVFDDNEASNYDYDNNYYDNY